MVCLQTMRGHFCLGRSAVKSRSSRFDAMLNVGSLSVVTLNLRVLSTTIPFSRISRPTRRWPRSVPTSLSSSIVFGRLWASIAAHAQARLHPEVCQNHHVHVLPAAGRAVAENTQPTGDAGVAYFQLVNLTWDSFPSTEIIGSFRIIVPPIWGTGACWCKSAQANQRKSLLALVLSNIRRPMMPNPMIAVVIAISSRCLMRGSTATLARAWPKRKPV